MDNRGIQIVIPDAELFPQVDPVDFFPQCLVVRVIKIQAADQIFSINGVWIRLCYRTKTLPDGKQISIADLVLPFMTIMYIHPAAPLFS